MTAAAVTLAVIAAVLEIWGLVWTIRDIRAARRNIASYLQLPNVVYGSAHGTLGVPRMTVHATVEGLTLEQRVEALEAAHRGLSEELDRREKKVTERLTKRFQGGLRSVEQTADDKFKKLRTYIEGSQQSLWDSYRGPIVLAIGVVVGLAGNVAGAM